MRPTLGRIMEHHSSSSRVGKFRSRTKSGTRLPMSQHSNASTNLHHNSWHITCEVVAYDCSGSMLPGKGIMLQITPDHSLLDVRFCRDNKTPEDERHKRCPDSKDPKRRKPACGSRRIRDTLERRFYRISCIKGSSRKASIRINRSRITNYNS